MIFHENRLLADDSHKICLIYSNKKETSDFHGTVSFDPGTVSFDPVKILQQK